MAGRSDIQAGAAFVRLYVKNNELIKGLKSAGTTVTDWGKNIAVVGGSISAIGGSIVGAMVGAAAQFASSGDEINKMAQRTGASTEALSELRYAAGQSGIELTELEGGFKFMSKAIDAARQGGDEANDTLARLGVSMADLATTPDKQMEIFADALDRIQDPSERAALALKIFGRSGTALLPLFADGAAGMRALREEAARMGLTIGQDQADAATTLGDVWDDVKAALAGATFAIGSALAPTLTDLLTILKEGAIKLGNFVRENKEMIILAAKAAVGLVLVGGVITGIGFGFIAAGAALTGFATVLTTIGSVAAGAVAVFTSLPGILAAIGIGGIAAFVAFTTTGRNALATVMSGFWELLAIGREAWGGIVDALKAGDLELAGQIAIAGLNVIWQNAIAAFRVAWSEIRFWFISIWQEATTSIASVFVSAFAGIESAWVTTTSFLQATFDTLRTNLLNGWQGLQKSIGEKIIAAAEESGAVSKEFAAAWRQSLAAPIDADIATRQQATDARLAEIEERKRKSLAAIESGASGTQAALEDAKRRTQQEAFDETQNRDRSGVEAAQERLDSLVAEATSPGEAAAAEAAEEEPIVSPKVAGKASTGTFSAAAALAMGGAGSVQERIAKTAEKQLDWMKTQVERSNDVIAMLANIQKGLTHG